MSSRSRVPGWDRGYVWCMDRGCPGGRAAWGCDRTAAMQHARHNPASSCPRKDGIGTSTTRALPPLWLRWTAAGAVDSNAVWYIDVEASGHSSTPLWDEPENARVKNERARPMTVGAVRVGSDGTSSSSGMGSALPCALSCTFSAARSESNCAMGVPRREASVAGPSMSSYPGSSSWAAPTRVDSSCCWSCRNERR